jgi:hypothetical protein
MRLAHATLPLFIARFVERHEPGGIALLQALHIDRHVVEFGIGVQQALQARLTAAHCHPAQANPPASNKPSRAARYQRKLMVRIGILQAQLPVGVGTSTLEPSRIRGRGRMRSLAC